MPHADGVKSDTAGQARGALAQDPIKKSFALSGATGTATQTLLRAFSAFDILLCNAIALHAVDA